MIRIALGVLWFSGACFSQTTISGSVSDSTGAAVAKAKLTLTSKAGGEPRKATAVDGAYRFENVAPGQYTLAAEAKQMAPAEKKIKLSAEPLQVDLTLEVAGAAEQVTVTAAKSKVEEESVTADRNADRLNFEDETLAALPAQGQNALSVVTSFLSPAAQGAEGVSVMVDGVESSADSMPAQSIRRIRINRNPYSVQFRRPGKARVEVYSEEGSYRRYRGAIGYSARNSLFDARNAFAPSRPDLSRGLLDFSLGGPIKRQRSAFFVNGELYRNNENAVVNALTPAGRVQANVPTPERRSRVLGRYETRTEAHSIVATYNWVGQSEENRGVGGLRLPEQGVPSSESANRFQFSDRALLFNRMLNDFRVVAQREETGRGFATTSPAIHVNGAFTGGDPQTFRSRRETYARLQDVANITAGRHTIRFGVEVRPAFYRSMERSNFGGTYEFSGLDAFVARRPILFRVNQGSPDVNLGQHEVAGFVQDETTLAPGLSVTYGIRYAWQSDVPDANNIAPRLGFAWSPFGSKTVIRGGAGVFYERVTEDVARRSLLWNGSRIRESIYFDPLFPAPFTGSALLPPPSVVRVVGNLESPVVTQASIGVERELFAKTTLTVEYQHLRGVHLLRSRNRNAPLTPLSPRPFDEVLTWSQVESSASMRSSGLSMTLRGGWKKRLNGMVQYSLSRTMDDSSGPFEFPANSYDVRGEWGRSDYDQRHRVNAFAMLELGHGLRFGGFLTAASGIPFNITTGLDGNRDSIVNDRPAGIARNSGSGTGLVTLDLRFTKLLRLPKLVDRGRTSGSRNVELSVDAFNLFNHTNYSAFIGVVSSPLFGAPNAARAPRTMQLSARYRF